MLPLPLQTINMKNLPISFGLYISLMQFVFAREVSVCMFDLNKLLEKPTSYCEQRVFKCKAPSDYQKNSIYFSGKQSDNYSENYRFSLPPGASTVGVLDRVSSRAFAGCNGVFLASADRRVKAGLHYISFYEPFNEARTLARRFYEKTEKPLDKNPIAIFLLSSTKAFPVSVDSESFESLVCGVAFEDIPQMRFVGFYSNKNDVETDAVEIVSEPGDKLMRLILKRYVLRPDSGSGFEFLINQYGVPFFSKIIEPTKK